MMEIVVRGRHITVPPRFRQHAAAKLAKLEKLDQRAVRIDVEVSKERNPRQSDRRERVNRAGGDIRAANFTPLRRPAQPPLELGEG